MSRYLTEFMGTFFLVLAVCLAAPSGGPSAALAIGGTLAIMVYMGGHISGGHYNPAVSLALHLRGILALADLLGYVLAQVMGAVCAALVAWTLSGAHFAPAPSAEAVPGQVLFAEAVMTFALALVVLNVATSKATEGNSYFGAAIGGTVACGVLMVGPLSGAVFNPAVGIGPIVVSAMMADGGFGALWFYLVGPVLGAAAAVPVFRAQDRTD